MPFATWWREDPLPGLAPLETFSAHLSTDIPLIADLTTLTQQAVHRRIQKGNQVYIGFMAKTPVAYGWVALQAGHIAELQLTFAVPAGNRYLWDFLTLPAWRGRGIYPHLLHEIMRNEQSAERFWIGFEPGNETSARSIERAGFRIVCDLVIHEHHITGLTLYDTSIYAQESAHFFQLPIIAGPE